MPRSKEIIGHKAVCKQFEQDIETSNVSHAYLLTGPEQIGKMTVAHWFAEKLLCQGKNDAQSEECKRHIRNLTHPDILCLDQLWIEGVCDDWDTIAETSNISQQHRSKAPKAKTDSISIDDIRSMQERLYEKGIGTWRCCIIRSVERMQSAAANAFLKILEEPPKGLVFILTTQAYSSLLPTIISRSRIVRMRRLGQKELLPLLAGVDEGDMKFILHIAQGAPGVLQALKEDPDLLRAHKQIHSKAASFWKSASLFERMNALKSLHKRSDESDSLLLHLALTLRENSANHNNVQALHRLIAGLQTNAHRQLLSQQFALAVMSL